MKDDHNNVARIIYNNTKNRYLRKYLKLDLNISFTIDILIF